MKKNLLLLFLGIFAAALVHAQSPFFTKADAFLKKNVSNGGVDYAGIKAAPGELAELVEMIAKFDLANATKGTSKAFYLNAYNILVIKNVVDHYPIAKPLDVAGFFDQVKFTVAGASLTLSDIENKKVRPTYQDARVHFALVCAAKSCPPLANYAFTPDKVDTQLETLTKTALNNKSFIRVDDTKKMVELSQILDWYKDDFLAVSPSLVAYVNKYRVTPIPATYKQTFYTYDWTLNKQ